MKKIRAAFLFINFALIIFCSSCGKGVEKEANITNTPVAVDEIDILEIANLTGCQFKIIKSETIGYIPLHKFLWICLEDEVTIQKLHELAEAIIKETIYKKPKTFHSFTIHFFLESDLKENLEKSKSFARANFLPEGKWVKVGRIPIEDYNDYKLILTYSE